MNKRYKREIEHFSKSDHIWWGARTFAGQKRYDQKLRLLRKCCGSLDNKKILEIGCGDGEFTKRLLKTKAKIIATDLTQDVIKRGKRLITHENLKFELQNAESLGYRDNLFDIVCGISILHHLNTLSALQEAKRVLKKDGQIFFTEPNLLNPHTYLGISIPFLKKIMEFSPDERPFLKWQLRKIVKKASFRKFIVNNYDFLDPLTPKWAISCVEKMGRLLEKLPIIKEFSGSFIIWARK